MRLSILLLFALLISALSHAQSAVQIKKVLDTTSDPIGYVKYVLKKKYQIDTVAVMSTTSFLSFVDSLAYNGKVGKTYGPFKKGNYLLKILVKAPNTFYHVSHILLDTNTFRKKFADSLAANITARIKNGSATFESMARTYSSDNSTASKGGDLGWFSRGMMMPELEEAIIAHRKGDIFTVWTDMGLNIITVKEYPKKDNGFALMLRVFL